jgi:hypothetical protein
MVHSIHKVTAFQNTAPYTLLVSFEDNTQQTINFFPVLFGEQFGPLKDLSLFKKVRIDHEVHTLVWPNGADFDPATLHDWPQYADEFALRMKQWQSASV